MRLFAVIAASAAVLWSSGGALAQPASPPISPEKLALAQRLFEISGGHKQMEIAVNTMYGAMFDVIGKNLPPEQQRLTSLVKTDLEAGVASMIPSFMDVGIKVYAENLTEKELSDYITFMQSDSARAIRAKTPTILRESIAGIVPIVTAAMPALMQKVVVDVCVEAKCTAQDRQVLADAMTKAAPHPQT